MSEIKILIVEDEAIVAEDIAYSLTRMGYSVSDIVSSGEGAIAAAQTQHPDLVLMDIMLQGQMDGIEATRQIREDLCLPVVYLTANADDHTLERAKVSGPFGYLLKPFKDKELRATIEIALSRHQADLEVKKALAMAENLRQEAQSESAKKSQYLSIASHEFRTPLSVIKMAAEILQQYGDRLTDEKKMQNLARIQSATSSMNQLLEDVLTLGKADAGRIELNPVPLEVVSFCQDLLDALQLSAGEEYTLKLQSPVPEIRATLDEKLLWHLLNNLLTNAIKYSPEGGIVSLTLTLLGEPSDEQTDEQICFTIRDQGIGMPVDYLDHLFEPFQRAKNVGKIEGTGLGLAIVKRSVDLHGGSISVDSAVNQGTEFTIKLPRHADSQTAIASVRPFQTT